MNRIDGISSGGFSAITNGFSAAQSAKLQQEMNSFQGLIDAVQPQQSTARTGSAAAESGRLNGDYISGFKGTFSSPDDKEALPVGAAANAGAAAGTAIDRTSKLYEKSLELESYFVKIMLSAMRESVSHSSLSDGQNAYARQMYEDMLYDELAVVMTKNAGFGLADQIYTQLA